MHPISSPSGSQPARSTNQIARSASTVVGSAAFAQVGPASAQLAPNRSLSVVSPEAHLELSPQSRRLLDLQVAGAAELYQIDSWINAFQENDIQNLDRLFEKACSSNPHIADLAANGLLMHIDLLYPMNVILVAKRVYAVIAHRAIHAPEQVALLENTLVQKFSSPNTFGGLVNMQSAIWTNAKPENVCLVRHILFRTVSLIAEKGDEMALKQVIAAVRNGQLFPPSREAAPKFHLAWQQMMYKIKTHGGAEALNALQAESALHSEAIEKAVIAMAKTYPTTRLPNLHDQLRAREVGSYAPRFVTRHPVPMQAAAAAAAAPSSEELVGTQMLLDDEN